MATVVPLRERDAEGLAGNPASILAATYSVELAALLADYSKFITHKQGGERLKDVHIKLAQVNRMVQNIPGYWKR